MRILQIVGYYEELYYNIFKIMINEYRVEIFCFLQLIFLVLFWVVECVFLIGQSDV